MGTTNFIMYVVTRRSTTNPTVNLHQELPVCVLAVAVALPVSPTMWKTGCASMRLGFTAMPANPFRFFLNPQVDNCLPKYFRAVPYMNDCMENC